MTSRSVKKRYIECPFCSGLLEPQMGRMKCPECRARFEYNEKMESIFVDIENLRLPVNGSVCSQCGLLMDKRRSLCVNCGTELNWTMQ